MGVPPRVANSVGDTVERGQALSAEYLYRKNPTVVSDARDTAPVVADRCGDAGTGSPMYVVGVRVIVRPAEMSGARVVVIVEVVPTVAVRGSRVRVGPDVRAQIGMTDVYAIIYDRDNYVGAAPGVMSHAANAFTSSPATAPSAPMLLRCIDRPAGGH